MTDWSLTISTIGISIFLSAIIILFLLIGENLVKDLLKKIKWMKPLVKWLREHSIITICGIPLSILGICGVMAPLLDYHSRQMQQQTQQIITFEAEQIKTIISQKFTEQSNLIKGTKGEIIAFVGKKFKQQIEETVKLLIPIEKQFETVSLSLNLLQSRFDDIVKNNEKTKFIYYRVAIQEIEKINNPAISCLTKGILFLVLMKNARSENDIIKYYTVAKDCFEKADREDKTSFLSFRRSNISKIARNYLRTIDEEKK